MRKYNSKQYTSNNSNSNKKADLLCSKYQYYSSNHSGFTSTDKPISNNNFNTNNNDETLNKRMNYQRNNNTEKVVIRITLENDLDLDLKEFDKEECVICLQSNFCYSFTCGHKSCGVCRKKWKKLSKTCPVCRRLIC